MTFPDTFCIKVVAESWGSWSAPRFWSARSLSSSTRLPTAWPGGEPGNSVSVGWVLVVALLFAASRDHSDARVTVVLPSHNGSSSA